MDIMMSQKEFRLASWGLTSGSPWGVAERESLCEKCHKTIFVGESGIIIHYYDNRGLIHSHCAVEVLKQNWRAEHGEVPGAVKQKRRRKRATLAQ